MRKPHNRPSQANPPPPAQAATAMVLSPRTTTSSTRSLKSKRQSKRRNVKTSKRRNAETPKSDQSRERKRPDRPTGLARPGAATKRGEKKGVCRSREVIGEYTR